MKPETEKRLAYAVVGGGLIPIACFLLADNLPHSLAKYVGWLISLPAFIYDALFPPPVAVEKALFADLPGQGFWVFLLVGNFILYSLLTYLGLWWKQRQSMPRLR